MATALPDLLRDSLPHLIDAAVRGAIVLLAALALTTLMRRRSAAARHAVWVGAISAQLLILVLTLWGPRWRVAAPEPVSALVPVEVGSPATVDRAPAPPALQSTQSGIGASNPAAPNPVKADRVAAPTSSVTQAPQVESATTPSARVSGRVLLGVLWALGALIVIARLAIGTTMVARLAQRGDRIEDGGWLALAQRLSRTLSIHRPLILMRGDRIGVPITWGIVYPVVLLPDDADSWPEERRRFVLVHEMAHVKRLDALTQLVGQVALALFWFDPLVWIATRRMQLEREHACDDYVLRHGTQASQYANDLLEMVRSLGTPSHRGAQPAFAALAMARRSEFEGRMLSILDPVLDRHPLSRGRTLMSALASLLVIVPLAALQPYRVAIQTSVSAPSPVSTSTSASASASATTDTTTTRRRASVADSHAVTGTDAPLSQRLQPLDSARSALGAASATSAASVRSSGSSTSSTSSSSTVSSTSSSSSVSSNRRDDDSCDEARFGGQRGTSTHIHADDDAQSGSEIRYLDMQQDRCLEVRIHGKYDVDESESHVIRMPPGSRMYLRERTPSENREFIYTGTEPSSGLSIARTYRRNGVEAPIDDAARQWVASILPNVLAELAINVEPRVARWRAEGGVDGALRHIAELHSSGAKRAHYEVILDDKQLKTADAEHLVRDAGRELPSSGDLRVVLSKAAPQLRTQSHQTSTLEEAIGKVASSGDRTAVLQLYGQTEDRDLLLSVMRIAETIPSSGDKSGLLRALTSRYFAKDDAALRETFFRTASTIPSSGDLANVLNEVIPFAAKSSPVALGVIATSTHIASSGDRTNVLVSLADAGGLRSTALRDAYLRAAQEIPSSGDMRRVLEALNRH